MEVALQIRRRRLRSRLECAAWLVPGSDPAALLEGLAEVGLEPLPRVYRVHDGFVVRPDTPQVTDFPGGVRLREIADGVFAPLDGELNPALLPDEIPGLTRGKCVVCLPEATLAFDPSRPVKPGALLSAQTVRRRKWQSLPAPPERPGEIRQFILDKPDSDVDELLNQGGKGIGEEPSRPDESGAGKRALGATELAAGKALSGLGKAFGLDGLKKAGGNMMGRAMNNSPRLSENLLGKQEAALRDLLRKFQEGNTDEALRRALPVGGETGRGARPTGNASLPFHSLNYSLGGILGGGGPAGMWFTEPDVYAALVREYRKAAEQAIKDGDHRRAAFIYGKLLGDYRGAANVLQKGGLHRDAAQIYLKKLNDTPAAARAYESAGDIDEAVKLYRRIGEHVSAGDLLKRAGDHDGALGEYRTGARNLADRGEYKSAGELMMGKAGDADEALVFFDEGWRARPHPNAVPCAVHMAVIHADREEVDRLGELTDQADRYFKQPGHDQSAAHYYNMLATLSERESLGDRRGELRDRALVGLAHKLRQKRGKDLPFDSRAWSNVLVSDARYALRTDQSRRPKLTGPRDDSLVTAMRLATGNVTAVAFAERTGELFVGLHDGRIVRFSAGQGVMQVRDSGLAVRGLVVDGLGQLIVVTHEGAEGAQDITCFGRDRGGRFFRGRGNLLSLRHVRPLCTGHAGGRRVTVFADAEEQMLTLSGGAGFEPIGAVQCPEGVANAPTARLLNRGERTSLLVFGDRTLQMLPSVIGQGGNNWQQGASHWRAESIVAGGELSVVRRGVEGVEFAGRNEHGSLYWSGVQLGGERLQCESRIVAARGDFLCAAMVGPGRVAGVTGSHINWFRKEGEGFALKSISRISAPDAVACFHVENSGELWVVTANGRLLMVPLSP